MQNLYLIWLLAILQSLTQALQNTIKIKNKQRIKMENLYCCLCVWLSVCVCRCM